MGDLPDDTTKSMPSSKIDEVMEKIKSVASAIKSDDTLSAAPVIQENFQLIEATAIIVEKHTLESCSALENIDISMPEYNQAIQGLDKFLQASRNYAKSPTPQNQTNVTSTSGHICDRLIQKILEVGGRSSVQAIYSELRKEMTLAKNIFTALNETASTLRNQANDITNESLHHRFSEDAKYYQRCSWLWLAMTLLSSCGLALYIHWMINLTIDLDVSQWTLAPKFTGSVLLLILTFSLWKNYHSYKHLQVTSKDKANLARIMPLMKLNMTGENEGYTMLQAEFLRLITPQHENGFVIQAKSDPISSVLNKAKLPK